MNPRRAGRSSQSEHGEGLSYIHPAGQSPLLTVSIVNYATPLDTLNCVQVARRELNSIPHEILVWDNAQLESEQLSV